MDPIDTSKFDQVINGYDPKMNIPFTIPGPAGMPSNTIDVNTLPRQAVEQLIQQYGGHPQLIGRLNYIEATEGKQNALNPKVDPLDQQLKDYQAQNEGLWNRYTDSAVERFNEESGRKRGKILSDEIAAGRGGSPVSNYTTGEFDRNAGMSLAGMLGDIAKQQATGQVDLAKTIENIRQGNQQFDKNFELGKNQFQAQINEANAGRLLSSDLARARMQHDTDISTPDDFQKWSGRIGTGLDLANKGFDLAGNIAALGKPKVR